MRFHSSGHGPHQSPLSFFRDLISAETELVEGNRKDCPGDGEGRNRGIKSMCCDCCGRNRAFRCLRGLIWANARICEENFRIGLE
ncbi:hypothetical protein AVEN_85674-1 [Araneus ventricosus]|uniref:Uncharacterized protein n=1 Tax=Araneus ventricosus TaxID=182803 RepID=A0A4Y2WDS4_ARAVE|nr:hypothetical protein AVEN_85674-1 [Araneus ventricosus]